MISIKWFLGNFHGPVETFLIKVILFFVFNLEFFYVSNCGNFSVHSLMMVTTLDHRTVIRHKLGLILWTIPFGALFVGQILILENTIKTSYTKNLRLSVLSRLFPSGHFWNRWHQRHVQHLWLLHRVLNEILGGHFVGYLLPNQWFLRDLVHITQVPIFYRTGMV